MSAMIFQSKDLPPAKLRPTDNCDSVCNLQNSYLFLLQQHSFMWHLLFSQCGEQISIFIPFWWAYSILHTVYAPRVSCLTLAWHTFSWGFFHQKQKSGHHHLRVCFFNHWIGWTEHQCGGDGWLYSFLGTTITGENNSAWCVWVATTIWLSIIHFQ